MISYALSFAAGFLTAISPCVLPVLPLVLGSAAVEHRHAPLAVITGMMTSFILLGVFLASAGSAIGISEGAIRGFAAVLLVLVGLTLSVPFFQSVIERMLQPIANAANTALGAKKLSGLHGQFLFGTLLGAIWSPCVGPTLGAAVGLASQGGVFESAIVMSFYAAGAAIPLLLVVYGSKKFLPSNRARIGQFVKFAKPAFGVVVVVVGIAILVGADKSIEANMLRVLPKSWIDLITKY